MSKPMSNHGAILQRAQLLLDQGRYADAADWFQQALALDPNDAQTLSNLAICWAQVPEKHGRAVQAARQAIALDPDVSHHHAVLAITLIDSAKPGQDSMIKEAQASATKALELDPDSSLAHAVLGLTHMRLHRYKEAEAAARQALALNTGNTMATQVLSMALLHQRKDEDLRSLVDWQLAENPDEDSAHVSAGFQALLRGKHRKACDHFREALRIDPTNENARDGLIESFRARSWVYGFYLRFCHFMMRFGRQGSTGVMVGGFILYRVAFASLRQSYPMLAMILAGAWMLLALWTFLARGIGSGLMLTDRFVRLAIRPKERWEGICVGGLVLIALVCLGAGLYTRRLDLALCALACVFAAVPVASAFSNDHHIGKWLYLAGGIVAAGSALIFTTVIALNLQLDDMVLLFQAALYCGVGTTWLRMLNIFYR